MDISFLLSTVFALASTFAWIRTSLKVPLPEKWTWFIGLGLVALYAIATALYATGGKYTALIVVLFPLQSTLETTGALALAIASYSSLHDAKISSHWFSLPTGCAPLAMASQYVPSYYIQLAIFVSFLIYSLGAKFTHAPSQKFVIPFTLLVGATVVRALGASFLVLSAENVYNISYSLGTVLLSFLATKDSLQIGKKKII
eukprot:c4675_g1_i1.p1 GENE.c4675_g1_i1~~c4675_g1_i1.p1  ORF type:complete len:201 (+),score=62.18 c4675_g1_i1:54-656(+)